MLLIEIIEIYLMLGNREADIEEIKNQIKYVNAHLIKNKFTKDYYQTLV